MRHGDKKNLNFKKKKKKKNNNNNNKIWNRDEKTLEIKEKKEGVTFWWRKKRTMRNGNVANKTFLKKKLGKEKIY